VIPSNVERELIQQSAAVGVHHDLSPFSWQTDTPLAESSAIYYRNVNDDRQRRPEVRTKADVGGGRANSVAMSAKIER